MPMDVPGDALAGTVPVLDALDCLRVAVTIYDARERLIYLNCHFNYLFRSMPPAHELVGCSYEDLIRMELTGGEIAAASFLGGEEAFIAGRCAQMREGDYSPRDIHLAGGRIVEIKMRKTAEGGWIALWSDVTEARHAFGRLETAIELSADAFALWDHGDRLVMCNPSFARLHGRTAEAELTGTCFAELIAEVANSGRVALDTTAEAWIEKRLKAHAGEAGALTVAMASGDAYLVRERATAGGGHATVYTDITDKARAEAAFAEQKEALAQTQRVLDAAEAKARKQANYLADLTRRLDTAEKGAAAAKTTFLRTMSHELKTPLNAIIGFSDMLKSAPGHFSADQIGEYAGLIHMAGGNLLRMLNQILDLTKIAAERFPLNCTPVIVSGVLRGAFDAVSARAENKSIAVTVEDCEAGLAADADENALTAMVGHLAENAVTFTQNGGSVRLSAARRNGRVIVQVEDNGPGVPENDLARIVEPFEQVSQSTADGAQGSGLGLPLVKALAELHGGTLSLQSQLGEGFTATLDLPAASFETAA